MNPSQTTSKISSFTTNIALLIVGTRISKLLRSTYCSRHEFSVQTSRAENLIEFFIALRMFMFLYPRFSCRTFKCYIFLLSGPSLCVGLA